MATGHQALITQSLLGQTLPDRVQVSVFAPGTKVRGDVRAQADHAHHYFRGRKGAKFDLGERDWVGPGYTVRVGDLTCKFGIVNTFSMSATFNPQRRAARAAGLTQWRQAEGGNTVLPLLAQGYDRAALRRGMCEDMAALAVQAKAAYENIAPVALGVPLVGEVEVNISSLELVFDFERPPEVIRGYTRAFGKVVRVFDGANGLAGRLRKGETFRIYAKPPVHAGAIVRFEMAVSGAKVKALTGSQRLPTDAAGVEGVLDALEARYMPVWLAVERHRASPATPGLARLIYRAPRFRGRDEQHFLHLARQFARAGWVKSNKRNRSKLVTLAKKGLVENLHRLTRVRGVYVATPESEPLWRVLGGAS